MQSRCTVVRPSYRAAPPRSRTLRADMPESPPVPSGRAQGAQGVTTTRHMALALDDSTPIRRAGRHARQEAARNVGTHEARAIALRRVVAEVNGTLELDAVLEDVLDSSQELFGADAAGLWQLQPRRQPFELIASRDLGQELIDVVASVYEDDDVMGLRAMRERRPIVLSEPAAAPRFGPIYERLGFHTVNFVPLLFRDEHVGLLVLYHRTPYDWTPDELELCTTFANQMATAFANARLFATVREGAARLRAIQELSSRLNRIQDVEKIGDAIVAEADRLIRHDTIRVYRVDQATGHVRADRVPRRGLGDRHPQPRRPAAPDRRGADRLGRRAQRDHPPGRRGRRPARPPARHRRGAGIDAPRADVLRVAGARRDRRVQGGLRPVQRGRPADAGDLRRLRGPGRRQRRGVRAGAPPAGRAAPPAREPAPPAGGQRAPARHPRPERRARDDRRLAQGRRLVRRADGLPRRSRRARAPGGARPRPLRRGDPPARGPAGRRHHWLGRQPRRGAARQ